MSEQFQTSQQVFDFVVGKLIEQGGPSLMLFGPNGTLNDQKYSCAYRGQSGHKCAAGWLIPDDVYTARMEGLDVGRLLTVHSLPVIKKFHGLVAELQDNHDSAWAPGKSDADWLVEFKKRARRTAREYCLEWNHGE